MDSAKVTKCVEIVREIQKNDPTEKTIVFSQFTSLLDLLEVPISKTGYAYRRYDGGMSASKRNQALLDFQDDADVKVLLVSLKAGNSGLNLVAASQVIMFGMHMLFPDMMTALADGWAPQTRFTTLSSSFRQLIAPIASASSGRWWCTGWLSRGRSRTE